MARTPKRPTKPAVRKGVAKPKAANGYESTRYNGRRSFLMLSPAQDNRRDLTPAARVEMLRKMRWGIVGRQQEAQPEPEAIVS